jgi:replicative DNA helicase Mcm
MTTVISEDVKKWTRFFNDYYKGVIGTLLTGGGKDNRKELFVDYNQIVGFDQELAERLLDKPDSMMQAANDGLELVELPVKLSKGDIEIRWVHLPKNRKILVRDLNHKHMGKLMSFEGVVRKTTDVKQVILVADFECQRCHNHMQVEQPGSGAFIEPQYCYGTPECEDKKGIFKLCPSESEWSDYQRVKLQENMDELKGGQQPENIDCNCIGSLINQVSPGEHVTVNGIMRVVQRTNKDGKTIYFDNFIDVVSIEPDENEFDDMDISKEEIEEFHRMARSPFIYRDLVGSIAPTIYGNEIVKLAIVHQLFGGVSKHVAGNNIRGDIHVLLVGDPGIAKSQIMRFAIKLAPRGIYASGKSASGAGLTAAAVKDEFDGNWTLEAGAMVLANNGFLGIDEMDKMKNDDRASLHEGLEQQSISVAKAGILATLKCKCSVLGAANPKLGKFDRSLTLAEQFNMPPSLLSRFDLIFILEDKPDAKNDGDISKHILRTHYVGELMEKQKIGVVIDEQELTEVAENVKPAIDPLLLKKYIAYAKRTVMPSMSREVREAAEAFYVKLRSANKDLGDDAPIPVTARQLEGVVRLLEARARARLSDTITLEDVKEVTSIITTCLVQVGYDEETGRFDINKIQSGVTKSQLDRIHTIESIIADLCKKSKDGCTSYEDVLTAAAEVNLDKSKVAKELGKLRERGMIFEPRTNRIQLSAKISY